VVTPSQRSAMRIERIAESWFKQRGALCFYLFLAAPDVDEKLSSCQLKMLSASQTYVQDGVFVAEGVLDLFKQSLSDGERGSYRRVRACGDMEWALLNLPGTEELMEYEARVNVLAQQHDCTLMCTYHVNRFSGRLITEVLATHSHVLLGNR